jgi:superfamily I DNA/RNA helicase
MEKYYRLNYIKLTTKTFETEETNQKIREDINSNRKINNKQNAIDNAIKDERRSKKYNFWIKKDGLLKMSSINSFKGMEIDTVILIINEVDDNDELIYTGLTRARENLIIFNLGNQRYKDFFAKNQNLLRKKKKYS